MKGSRRLERMQRKHSRLRRPVPLNLVAMIDIFMVMVFFLLVNYGDVTLLAEAEDLVLPASVAEVRPTQTIVVVVSRNNILVGGQAIATIEDVERSTDPFIPELQEAVRRAIAAAPVPPSADGETTGTRRVTILGDKGTRYEVLKKIMKSCVVGDVGKIAFAVTPTAAYSGFAQTP